MSNVYVYTIPASEIVEGDLIDMEQYDIVGAAEGDEIVAEYELCSVEAIESGPAGELAIYFANIHGSLVVMPDTEIDIESPTPRVGK